MAKAYPREFRDDVVAVALKGQSPSKQMAKDFGISEGCLHGWMKRADSEDGNRPGVTAADQLELREARGANPAARAGERGAAAGGSVSVAGEPAGKTVFPLVREMAAAGAPIRVPVAVACRVLGRSAQGYYQVVADPCVPGRERGRDS